MAESMVSRDDFRYLSSTSGHTKLTDLSLVGLRMCFCCFLEVVYGSDILLSLCFFLENIV